MSRKNVRTGIAAIAVLAGAGLLAGCADGVGLADTIDSTTGSAAQLNPLGCQQTGNAEDGNLGWSCASAGGPATITVPAGATGVRLALAGGQGGEANPAAGGYGTALAGSWPVTPGQTITVYVGAGTTDSTGAGGANPGANGGCSHAGGGGGATSVEIGGTVAAVAGGGGGGGAQGMFPGADDGGAGGTTTVNGGNGSDGSGLGHGDGGLVGSGSSFTKAWPGGSGSTVVGGCGGGAGGGWAGGNGGKSGGPGGGGGGGAGSDYTSPAAQAVTAAPANGGGDGSASLIWIG
jgi:hypothetical protein